MQLFPKMPLLTRKCSSYRNRKNGGPKYGRLPVLSQAGSAGSGPQVVNPIHTSAKRSMGNLLASSTSGRRRPRRPNLEPRSAIRFLKECGKNHRTSPGAVPPRTRASHSHHPSRGGAAARQNGAESGGASKWRRELSAYGPRVCVVCRLVPIFKAGDTKLNILNIHSRQSANHHNLIWKGENAVVDDVIPGSARNDHGQCWAQAALAVFQLFKVESFNSHTTL